MALLRDFGVGRHDLNPQNSAAMPAVQIWRPPGTHAKALIREKTSIFYSIEIRLASAPTKEIGTDTLNKGGIT